MSFCLTSWPKKDKSLLATEHLLTVFHPGTWNQPWCPTSCYYCKFTQGSLPGTGSGTHTSPQRPLGSLSHIVHRYTEIEGLVHIHNTKKCTFQTLHCRVKYSTIYYIHVTRYYGSFSFNTHTRQETVYYSTLLCGSVTAPPFEQSE